MPWPKRAPTLAGRLQKANLWETVSCVRVTRPALRWRTVACSTDPLFIHSHALRFAYAMDRSRCASDPFSQLSRHKRAPLPATATLECVPAALPPKFRHGGFTRAPGKWIPYSWSYHALEKAHAYVSCCPTHPRCHRRRWGHDAQSASIHVGRRGLPVSRWRAGRAPESRMHGNNLDDARRVPERPRQSPWRGA